MNVVNMLLVSVAIGIMLSGCAVSYDYLLPRMRDIELRVIKLEVRVARQDSAISALRVHMDSHSDTVFIMPR